MMCSINTLCDYRPIKETGMLPIPTNNTRKKIWEMQDSRDIANIRPCVTLIYFLIFVWIFTIVIINYYDL